MKKLISMLSLAAIVVSALFVSCAKPKVPTVVPAFPYDKTAIYTQNVDSGVWAWSYASGDKYTNALGVGFQASKLDPTFLEYRFTPNMDWTLEIVGNGKEYVEAYRQDGYFKVEELTFASSLSGLKGQNTIGFRVIKTPESYEEAVDVEVALTMAGETMVILTLTLEPAIW
jgi:hypothetical protein